VSTDTLEELAGAGAICDVLTREDVRYLKRLGILDDGVAVDGGDFVTPSGVRLIPDLGDAEFLDRLEAECLGETLKGGVVASAGFFLGPADFYEALRDLPEAERALINMTSVLRVNHLYEDVELDTLQRKDARFINSCLMATLTGAVVSDGLENQQVLSGVGGQSDFVSMAHALPDGRSIITVRSTRDSDGGTTSNIRFGYGHTTIPRHMRDIVVTEYGIADLRGKSDAEVIAAMLNVADSRFQGELMKQAKRAGKLPNGHRIPEAFRHNTPEALDARLAGAHTEGWIKPFPFGSDFTEIEAELAGVLKRLAARGKTLRGKLRLGLAAARANPGAWRKHLERLGLASPDGWRERLRARLVAGELERRP